MKGGKYPYIIVRVIIKTYLTYQVSDPQEKVSSWLLLASTTSSDDLLRRPPEASFDGIVRCVAEGGQTFLQANMYQTGNGAILAPRRQVCHLVPFSRVIDHLGACQGGKFDGYKITTIYH